jgi:hypothetical protein
VKRSLACLLAVMIAGFVLLGCTATQPTSTNPAPVKDFSFSGVIVSLSGNEITVYVYEGYRGLMVLHVGDKTAIDAALKKNLQANALITFTTDGSSTKSLPPQATALTIKSVTAPAVYKGVITEVTKDRILIRTSSPAQDIIAGKITARTSYATDVYLPFFVGDVIEFVPSPVMQPSEPAQIEMLRILRKGPALSERSGQVSGIQGGFIRVGAGQDAAQISVPNMGQVSSLKSGTRVVALVAVRGQERQLEQLRLLPTDPTVVGHFAYVQSATTRSLLVILMDGGALTIDTAGVSVPASVKPGQLIYAEYRVDKKAEANLLRSVESIAPDSTLAMMALNATYMLNGKPLQLRSGAAEIQVAPEPARPETVTYWNMPVAGDLNGDRKNDAAFLMVRHSAGTGEFYYVVAYISSPDSPLTNAVFLGDRIAPQNMLIKDGAIIVNFADRKPGEPMVARPSVGVTKTIRLVDGVLK